MIDFAGLFKLCWEVLATPSDNAFYPFERACFSQAFAQLEPKLKAIFEQQLKVINRIQRIDGGKMVNLYTIKDGKSAFPDELCVRNIPEETIFFCADIRKNVLSNIFIEMKVFLVQGQIFEINYSRSPRDFFNREPKTVDFHVHNIVFHIDTVNFEPVAH